MMSTGTASAEPGKLPTADELLRRTTTLVVAHRGLPIAAPENTLPAFSAALEQRPDFVELDYRLSADNVPIVIHDEKLDRTTNAATVFGRSGTLLGEKTAAELAKLDAGSWYGAKFTDVRLPTLEAAIDLVCPKTCLMIERKGTAVEKGGSGVPAGDAATLVDLLRKKNVLERVIVQSFEWDFIAEVRKLEPNLPTGLLGEHELDAAKLTRIRTIAPRVIGWNQRDLRAAGILAAHDAGVKAWSYTINDPRRARDLVAAGLDGVITNHADKVRAWLADGR